MTCCICYCGIAAPSCIVLVYTDLCVTIARYATIIVHEYTCIIWYNYNGMLYLHIITIFIYVYNILYSICVYIYNTIYIIIATL